MTGYVVAPDVEVTWTGGDLNDMELFENIGFADVLNALKALSDFLDDYAARLDDLRLAIGRRDAGQVAIAAHTFKGMTVNFSRETAGAAHALEVKGRSGNLDGAEAAFQVLEERVAALVPSLAALVAEKVC